MTTRTALFLLAASAAVVALAGCSSGPQYSDLAGEPISDRSIYDELGAISLEGSDPRWVGEYEGTDLWVFDGRDERTCVLINPEVGSWVVSCGETFAVSGVGGHEFVLLPDGETYDRPVTAISKNVYVVD